VSGAAADDGRADHREADGQRDQRPGLGGGVGEGAVGGLQQQAGRQQQHRQPGEQLGHPRQRHDPTSLPPDPTPLPPSMAAHRPAIVTGGRGMIAAVGEAGRIRMVVLDVDGTLLTSDARLSPRTVAAVGRARERGLEVCLATSRGPGGLRWLVGRLGLDVWAVAYQGALVGRLDRTGALAGEPLLDDPMPAGAARAVLAEAAAAGLSCSWFAGGSWYALADDEAMRREAAIVRDRFVVAGAPTGGLEPHKLMLIAGHPDLVPALHGLAGRLPAACAGYFSHDNYLEVTRAGVDKAQAMVVLARRLGIPLAEAAAVGDGQNDLGLLGAVGLPIAMGNAKPALKAIAAFVTGSNDDDGAAAALDRLADGG
jgi:Cof subfamily protein (haloacid dehalogenase superfamily)